MIGLLLFWHLMNLEFTLSREVTNALFDGIVLVLLTLLFHQLKGNATAQKGQEE